MKGVKGSETKRLIREAAYKQFLTKDYNTVPLKEDVCHIIIQASKNCLLM